MGLRSTRPPGSLGCYSALPLATLPLGQQAGPLVLVLNSNIFTARYGKMTGKERQAADAQRELDWLGGQLRTAAANHRQVLIAMHVPPGKDGYLKAAANRETCTGNFKDLWDTSVRVPKEGTSLSPQNIFLDLVDAYRNSIVGIVSSHTHMDGIRLLKDRTEDSVSALLISAPGIAPGHGNNPGFKLVGYDPVNFQLNGFTTFYSDFYPDRTVKTWGDLSFSFPPATSGRSTAGRSIDGLSTRGRSTSGSMLDRLRTLPADSLRAAVNSIYTVHNGDGYAKGNCVDTTLYVHFQP